MPLPPTPHGSAITPWTLLTELPPAHFYRISLKVREVAETSVPGVAAGNTLGAANDLLQRWIIPGSSDHPGGDTLITD